MVSFFTALPILSANSFAPESIALFARMSTPPSSSRKSAINNLIKSLQVGGVWAKLDALYVFAAADSQAALLNWVSTNYNATAQNSPTFTADRGFSGNGSSSYISSNFNPSTASSPKFVQNSAHVAAYSRTSGVIAAIADIGQEGSDNVRVAFRSTSDATNVRLNSASGASGTNSDGSGNFIANRASASSQALYRNSVSIGSSTDTSSSVVSSNVTFLRRNAAYSTRQLASASIGSALSSDERAAYDAAIQNYMTAVGA